MIELPFFATCPHCGLIHMGPPSSCSRIRSIEYYQDGTIKRIEYHDYSQMAALYPPVLPVSPLPPSEDRNVCGANVTQTRWML